MDTSITDAAAGTAKMPNWKRRPGVVGAAIATFLLPIWLFPTLHRVHPYYRMENAIFLLAAVAALISWLPGYLPTICLGAAMALQLATFDARYRPMLQVGNALPVAGATVARLTKPDDVILIYGQEWNPQIPYYAGRRAVMMTDSLYHGPTPPFHIDAILDCRYSDGCHLTKSSH